MDIDHKFVKKLILKFIFVILLLPACICSSCFPEVERWYSADEVYGEWQTKVIVFEGVLSDREVMYKSDCENRDDCFIQEETCIPVIVDDYLPIDSNTRQIGRDLYDPRGDISLDFYSYHYDKNGYRYVVVEYFVADGCRKTNKPAGGGYNYLDCPKWERVDVSEIVQREDFSCKADLVTYRQLETYALNGEGTEIEWQNPPVPSRGKTQRLFSGLVTVIAKGGDVRYEFTNIRSIEEYLERFAKPQYIGVNPEGTPAVAGTKDEMWIMYGNIEIE